MKKSIILMFMLTTIFASAHSFEARIDLDLAVPCELAFFDRAGIYIGGAVGADLFFTENVGLAINCTMFVPVLSIGWGISEKGAGNYGYTCGPSPSNNSFTLDTQLFVGAVWKMSSREKRDFLMSAGVEVTFLTVDGKKGTEDSFKVSAINFGVGLEQKYEIRLSKHVGIYLGSYESFGIVQTGTVYPGKGLSDSLFKIPIAIRCVPKAGILFTF